MILHYPNHHRAPLRRHHSRPLRSNHQDHRSSHRRKSQPSLAHLTHPLAYACA